MVSNFLGEVRGEHRRSAILSAAELIAREGVNLTKGMNYRDSGPLLSVFLVLRRGGEFKDVWDEENWLFTYEGHDSTTVESGKMTDNGRFYKAAHAFKDGLRKEPLQVQVYEKLSAGVWYDKGTFDLIDAKRVSEGGRMVFKFHLSPADMSLGYSEYDTARTERFLPAVVKEEVWARDGGRCGECGAQSDLYFVGAGAANDVRLCCSLHGGRRKRGLL